eukprot:TRINITY_DN61554_c0_g1_i2.p1 TRINITY_DN61554_c0_g1~~TRINITY_DN61554_c0_g1_i2.p1  ORF type:complete len:318 (-),score=34.99 TRINITY_DN61554_c0_g1_i2:39-992(-)
MERTVAEALDAVSEEAHTGLIPTIDVRKISPISFYRDYVAQNKPAVLTHMFDDWAALSKWTVPYLIETLGDTDISVNCTPNGRADAIIDDDNSPVFAMPEERQLTFKQFWNGYTAKGDEIFYISHQNSSFQEQFACLHNDISGSVASWGAEVFGCSADAVNLWVGGDESVSSLHKDHYENLYAVVKGEKLFTLLPPHDFHMLYETTVPQAVWEKTGAGEWNLRKDGSTVNWIAVDPTTPDLKQFPKFSKAKPLHCKVKRGELLYLPSLWYHQVGQCGEEDGVGGQHKPVTVAVNYWFDMQFGPMYHYYNLVRALSTA